MNYLSLLTALMSIIPTIANNVNLFHSDKPLSVKLDAAGASFAVAGQTAAAVLPPDQGRIAAAAAVALQAILHASVTAIHDATNPIVG